MDGDSIDLAVNKLEADTIAKRTEGLEELRRALSRPRAASNLHARKDEAWHKTLEHLFTLTRSDKSKYLHGSDTVKKKVLNRLETTSLALRLVVEICHRLIKHKTVYAALDHIIDILGNDGSLFQPIRTEYLRTFRIVLSEGSHCEHLRPQQWRTYVDFVIENINANSAKSDTEASTNGSVSHMMSFRTSQTSNARSSYAYSQGWMDDLLTTLRNLSSTSNAPLLSRTHEIAGTAIAALSSSTRTLDIVFETLNTVILLALTEDIKLVANIVEQATSAIRRSLTDSKATIRQREQVMTTLYLTRNLFGPKSGTPPGMDPATRHALADTLLMEYQNRKEEDLLQVSDLVFDSCGEENFFLRSGMGADQSSTLAVLNWTTVAMAAILNSSKHLWQTSEDAGAASEQRAPKRQKMSSALVSFLSPSSAEEKTSYLPRLQIACFMVDIVDIKVLSLKECVSELLTAISEDRKTRPSWALIALSRLSASPEAQRSELRNTWVQVWEMASHFIASSAHSRAACFTMMTLLENGLISSTSRAPNLSDICFQGGSKGPPSLTDAAILFFTSCARSKLLLTERHFSEFLTKTLSWLDLAWTLPSGQEHALAHIEQVARMGQPVLLYNLFVALTGARLSLVQRSWPASTSEIIRAYLQHKDDGGFSDFLLGVSEYPSELTSNNYQKSIGTTSSARSQRSLGIVLALLTDKIQKFRDAYLSMSSDRGISEPSLSGRTASRRTQTARNTKVSIEYAEILTTMCTVASAILALSPQVDKEDTASELWQCVMQFLSDQHHDNVAEFENSSVRIARRLLDIKSADAATQHEIVKSRYPLVKSLQETVATSDQISNDGDEMDDEFQESRQSVQSQQSQSKSQKNDLSISRRDISICIDDRANFVETKFLLIWQSLSTDLSESTKSATAITDFVLSLNNRNFLAIHHVLLDYLKENMSLSSSEIARLLERAAEVCLQVDDNERNEAALCFCFKLMRLTAHIWSSTEDEYLSNIALDVYNWIVTVALGKGIASTKVLYNISSLLESLLRYRPRYGTQGDKPLASPRTNLLQILKTGPSALRYLTVSSLTTLFEGYVLTEHAAIFDDIVDCLPTDPDGEEGIASRLYILAKLGSTWRTVLRQAIYHIFETVANVPTATSTAHCSLDMMAAEVEVDSVGQLLHLFSPQILYTWLENGEIATIPFVPFGYHTLRDLIYAEKEELVAQVALRQNPKHVQLLETMLGQSWVDLLRDSFPRSQVYAMINDVAVLRVGFEVGPTESVLRTWLGHDEYTKCAQQAFPESISHAIVSLSDDKGLEKVLGSSTQYNGILENHEKMRQRGHSTVQHPARQQPCFRVKYLMQILHKICHGADVDLFSCWTPALTTFVYRKILDDAHPALGPLHVASMVRKIRIAVSLAGSVALKGYPLEMLLQSLRPYLTNFHCAEDTVGIYWYLLEQGQDHLERRLSFIAGLGVAIFSALSVFAASTQETTTQESQFLSTMAKAKEFRRWLGQFLFGLNTAHLAAQRASRFHDIIGNAKDITTSGSNNLGDPEGMLLHHILLDQASTEPLVLPQFFSIIIQALSDGFRLTAGLSSDIMSQDCHLIRAAPVLLSAMQETKTSKMFLVWAGSALGRAYTIHGPSLTLSLPCRKGSTSTKDGDSFDATGSYSKIFRALVDMLWSDNSNAVSIAEQTLSFVLSSMAKPVRLSITSALPGSTGLNDLLFESLCCPQPRAQSTTRPVEQDPVSGWLSFGSSKDWASSLAKSLISPHKSNQFLAGLLPILQSENHFAQEILPSLIHLVLDAELEEQQVARDALSNVFNEIFQSLVSDSQCHVRLSLSVVLYLRSCIYPHEITSAKRNHWLNVDYGQAAAAASSCNLPHTALLLLEIEHSETALQATRARRSSVKHGQTDPKLLADIFSMVDDPDFFYGNHEESDVTSVLAKLQHEGQGDRVLAMQSALFDSHMKVKNTEATFHEKGEGIISALSLANLNGLAYATRQYVGSSINMESSKLLDESLLNVSQWDVPSTSHKDDDASLANVLSAIETVQTKADLNTILHVNLRRAAEDFISQSSGQTNPASRLVPLASLSDVFGLVTGSSTEDMNETWAFMSRQHKWTSRESFDSVSPLLTAREATFSAMRRNEKSSNAFQANHAECLLFEIKAVRDSLATGRIHDASQFCLNRAMYLTELQRMAEQYKLNTYDVITYDVANILWSQGEISAPVSMLKALQGAKHSESSEITISKAELLTDLGQKLSQARLDRPDEVTANYLQPAIKALEDVTTGSMAGRVYHNFAAFCDEQLQDSVSKDDFERIEKIRNRKLQEVNDLADMYKKSEGRTRDTLRQHYSKAKTWFKLDDEEYKRLKLNREQLLQRCLENYLLSLQACDDYAKDILRFLSLWLANTNLQEANASVQAHLSGVPTIKFAPFVNQLSSRMLDNGDRFQKLLSDLMFRICCDHPYHSLYQLFAVWKTKGAVGDEVASSRHKAAARLANTVQSPKGGSTSQIWISVHNSNINFVQFAQERQEKEMKTGSKIPIRKFKYGQRLEQTIQGLAVKIPPPTMKIPLRVDKDYLNLPTFTTFEPQISIAGGVSAPKIVTVVAIDGSRHKMLLKGGNDDLRQDAIMEQVFEQVSDLLDDHRPTRQRNLGIRTYKVIPLKENAGIIEFVQSTIPLHDYLLPAHTRYFPKDYKANMCRKIIADAQAKMADERLKVYRTVVEHFHPVMRFFFMEHFLDPNEWFHKRLNYSRSTAAISILGHVLGLGDRHGHNILLDEQTGEVVHIDLGVAFEAGRVLPVPEVVPFRLTRDLVDGMGLSGVEGPFRRCCNFTLEALRKNQDAIMTILDVLRWDPLYSWSVSPLRLQRMQDNQEREAAAAAETANGKEITPGIDDGESKGKKPAMTTGGAEQAEDRKALGDVMEQAGEADRALAIVAKKLSATLSVEATVNELIRQATDERNLSVLYCGWGAYA